MTTPLRRWLAASALLLAAGFSQAALDTSAATDDHSINTPTAWWTYSNISPADLSSRLSENRARLVELEVIGTVNGEPRFLARMVANSGAYAVPGWWWYYDKTAADITALLNANTARLIEIERYDRGGGQIRYAVVMVPNTGSMQRAWSYLLDATASQMSSHMSGKNMRPIDIDSRGSGSSQRFDGIFVSNTSADAKAYQWASNQTLADIGSKTSSFQGRVVKIERQADGRYSFVQVKATGSDSTAWWNRYGFASLTDLNNYALQFAARPVDIVSYLVGTTRFYDATFIDNANTSTRRMRNEFSMFVEAQTQTPRGIFAAYLKRLDGGITVDLNRSRQAETASALKVLHLLHTMRQVMRGLDTLNEAFDYYNYPPFGYDPKFPPEDHCPDPNFEIEANRQSSTLEPAMDQMMDISDNRIARAVVIRAGDSFAPLNTTALNAGMVGTTLRHNIGCAYALPGSNYYSPGTLRNNTTAADLAGVYEGVWTQRILGNANGARDAFLRAANPSTGASEGLQAVIDQEAAALGKSSIAASFGSLVQRWSKGGRYGTCLGDPQNPYDCGQRVLILSNAGLLALPAKANGIVALRYYALGSYVSDVPISAFGGSEEDALRTEYARIRDELLRDEIRAALQTW